MQRNVTIFRTFNKEFNTVYDDKAIFAESKHLYRSVYINIHKCILKAVFEQFFGGSAKEIRI